MLYQEPVTTMILKFNTWICSIRKLIKGNYHMKQMCI